MSSDLPLAGRVAVVTGASSGIGEHTARELDRCDPTVALLARRADRLRVIAAEIEAAGGQAAPTLSTSPTPQP